MQKWVYEAWQYLQYKTCLKKCIALCARAAKHGRSTEAEVRAILEDAVKLEGRVKLGSLLAGIGQRTGLKDEDFVVFEQRDKTPAQPMSFE